MSPGSCQMQFSRIVPLGQALCLLKHSEALARADQGVLALQASPGSASTLSPRVPLLYSGLPPSCLGSISLLA